MMFPPSLAAAVLNRAFRSENGEFGVHLGDAHQFLEACRKDGVEVLGWEFWIIDHSWTFDDQVPQQGSWCGGVPLRSGGTGVFRGDGDADTSEAQINSFDLEAEVAPDFLPLVRVNFTLEG